MENRPKAYKNSLKLYKYQDQENSSYLSNQNTNKMDLKSKYLSNKNYIRKSIEVPKKSLKLANFDSCGSSFHIINNSIKQNSTQNTQQSSFLCEKNRETRSDSKEAIMTSNATYLIKRNYDVSLRIYNSPYSKIFKNGKILADHKIIDTRIKTNFSSRGFNSVKPCHKKSSSFAESKYNEYYTSCPKRRNRNDRGCRSISSNNSVNSLHTLSDSKASKKSLYTSNCCDNQIRNSLSRENKSKEKMKDIKKIEMISSAKSINQKLLSKISKKKKFTKRESTILCKFCQLINECRLDESHERRSYKSTKSQLIFIDKNLQIISSSVSKRSESGSLERPQKSLKYISQCASPSTDYISIKDEKPSISIENKKEVRDISISKIEIVRNKSLGIKEEAKKFCKLKKIFKIERKDRIHKDNIDIRNGQKEEIMVVLKGGATDGYRDDNVCNEKRENAEMNCEVRNDSKIGEECEKEKELLTLSESSENFSFDDNEFNRGTPNHELISKEIIIDCEKQLEYECKSHSASSKEVSLSDFEQEFKDSENEINLISPKVNQKLLDMNENNFSKFQAKSKGLKQSLSTIEENHSIDESCDEGINTNYYDSLYSLEPFDLQNLSQEQLNAGEFKLNIDNASQVEENDFILSNEILVDDLLININYYIDSCILSSNS